MKDYIVSINGIRCKEIYNTGRYAVVESENIFYVYEKFSWRYGYPVAGPMLFKSSAVHICDMWEMEC